MRSDEKDPKQNVLAIISSYSNVDPKANSYVAAFKVNSPNQLIPQIKIFLQKEVEGSNFKSAQEEIENELKSLALDFNSPLPDPSIPDDEILQNLDNFGIGSLIKLDCIKRLYFIEYYTIQPKEEDWLDEAESVGICALTDYDPSAAYNFMNIEQLFDKDAIYDPYKNIIGWEPNINANSNLPSTLPTRSYLRFWEDVMGPAFVVPIHDATK